MLCAGLFEASEGKHRAQLFFPSALHILLTFQLRHDTAKFFFESRLVSKKSKLKLYWSIVRPIVTYACDAWVLKETVKKQVNGICKENS
jgi:hypothetical protein